MWKSKAAQAEPLAVQVGMHGTKWVCSGITGNSEDFPGAGMRHPQRVKRQPCCSRLLEVGMPRIACEQCREGRQPLPRRSEFKLARLSKHGKV